MSFLAPLAFAFAALAIPITIFYILKIRLRRVPVTTTIFWQQIFEEKQARSFFQNLRHLISLLLQLLLLLLFVLSLTQPYFNWELLQSRKLVLVLDDSASMSATVDGESRWQSAKTAAIQLVAGLRFRDEVAIIRAGADPTVICGFTGHERTLRTALDSVAPGDGPTHVPQAVAMARRLLGDTPNGVVHVFSDGCFDTATELLEQSATAKAAGTATASGSSTAAATGAASGDPTAGAATPTQDARKDGPKEAAKAPAAATPAVPTAPVSGVPAAATADAALPAGAPVVIHPVGKPLGNIGITQFQVRRSLVDPLGYQLLVEVQNCSDDERSCRLDIDLSDRAVEVVPLKLKPGEAWRRTLDKTATTGGTLLARLVEFSTDDALTTDNSAYAVLPQRELIRVTLVTEGNLFLQKVLEANPLVNLTVSKVAPESPAADEIVLFHKVAPAVLPRCRVFVVAPQTDCDAFKTGAPVATPIVVKQDAESLLMAHVKLDNVLMPDARTLTLGEEWQVLISGLQGEPFFASLDRPAGRLLVLTVDLDSADLPLRTAFPILMSNALGWFTGNSGELRESIATGSMTALELPAGRRWELEDPRGAKKPLPETLDSIPIGPLDIAGVWRIVPAAGSTTEATTDASAATGNAAANGSAAVNATTTTASTTASTSTSNPGAADSNNLDNSSGNTAIVALGCNLANHRESDLRPPENWQMLAVSAASGSHWFVRPVWFYLLLVALVLATTEWFLYQRRWIT